MSMDQLTDDALYPHWDFYEEQAYERENDRRVDPQTGFAEVADEYAEDEPEDEELQELDQ